MSLSVHDLERAVAFYGEAFGIDEVRARLDLPAAGVRSAIVASRTGVAIEFLQRAGARSRPVRDAIDAAGTTGWVHLALRVDDLGAAVDQALAAGARLISGPAAAQRPATWFAYLADPEGHLLELVSGSQP